MSSPLATLKRPVVEKDRSANGSILPHSSAARAREKAGGGVGMMKFERTVELQQIIVGGLGGQLLGVGDGLVECGHFEILVDC